MVLSPQRKVLLEFTSLYFPFCSIPAYNIVDELEKIASSSGDNGDDQDMNVRTIQLQVESLKYAQ